MVKTDAFEGMAKRIKESEMTRRIKEELWVLVRRGNAAVRKGVGDFLDYTDRNPHVREWLKSSAIVGVSLELLPFSRLVLLGVPGFVPGAVAGYLKGGRTDSSIQSAVIGGISSWPIKPVLMLSPIAGMLIVAFAAGVLEETLAKGAACSKEA